MLTALYVFDWVNITISFFNTITMLWLGLTVLLNAERRSLGTWAIGGGLLFGSIFFAGHTAVVARVLGTFNAELEFWWRFAWAPFIGGPYLWYMVIAWYTGGLRRLRYRLWLVILGLLGITALGLLVFGDPLPPFEGVLQGTPTDVFAIGGVPVLGLVYPVYSMLCILHSLLALRHPAASHRFMGDEARRRARPWLVVAALLLLLVSVLVGVASAWFLYRMQQAHTPLRFTFQFVAFFIAFDLLISGMVAVVAVCIGRAVASYEVFTGKVLPRGGLFRHWRNSLILAAGYGGLMSASLALPVDPIYRLLLATILMTVFYALVSWRTYRGHERSMERLRPFVTSQRLYEQLLSPATPPEVDAATPLRALCEDVLNARALSLVVLGPLAPLMGPGLIYPQDGLTLPPDLNDIIRQFYTPQTLYVPLKPARDGGAVWAVPLWSERGLIGMLLLGEKRDGGLYTQEEIEIARATGERLIDTQASAELARRLMTLQRQRLADSQVLDRRTRRVLHDDVLPHLHTAMLLLGSVQAPAAQAIPDHFSPPATDTGAVYHEAVALLTDVHQQIANLLHALPPTAAPEVARLGLIGALRQAVEHELASDFDGVNWRSDPAAEQATRAISSLAAEVIFYAAREAIRNAARYGRSSGSARPLHLTISVAWREGLELLIEDDGVGIDATRTTASTAGGSGQGLALHSTMMAVIGGTLTVESEPGAFTRVLLALPSGA